MRYHALACDYDGTLAQHGRVDTTTLAALERLRATGRRIIMVTGREMEGLMTTFNELDLFDEIVAENGALLYRPSDKQVKLLAEAPPERFATALRERGVGPMSVGHCIVATWTPHEQAVLETIRDLGLELQVIFNKGAVMVLPAGVNKATGLAAALKELELSPHEVVGVGDAENDHAFLALCECAAAVANALPALKDRADLVTRGDHGAGVTELIDEMIANDLADRDQRLARHHLLLGARADGAEVRLSPFGVNVLIAGPSGSGKSNVATSFLEQLAKGHYQFCIIDPEGDYQGLRDAIILGGSGGPPTAGEVLQLLKDPEKNVVVNLLGLALADRPPFFATLLPRLQEMRSRTGRPHWLMVDEAHHLLPASWVPGHLALPPELKGLVLITVHPGQIAPAALANVDHLLAVGPSPQATIDEFCKTTGEAAPAAASMPQPAAGEVVLWSRCAQQPPSALRMVPSRTERRRHARKYAEGELPPERSFYFTGPEGKLNLRAQNLILFLQMAQGVDDATWEYHLRRNDYSRWFHERIKDDALATEAAAIEQRAELTPTESKRLIQQLVEKYYTLPARTPLPMPGTNAAPTRSPS